MRFVQISVILIVAIVVASSTALAQQDECDMFCWLSSLFDGLIGQVTAAGFQQGVCNQTLDEAGATYTLTADIGPCSGDALTIVADNITLDCAGHKIIGVGVGTYEAGVYLEGYTNKTVKNCEILNFINGIRQYSSQYDTIVNNVLHDNSGSGISAGGNHHYFANNRINGGQYGLIFQSADSYNTFVNNTINGTSYGVRFWFHQNFNTFISNNITNNLYGVYHKASLSNIFTNNTIAGNSYGIYLFSYYDGPILYSSDNNTYNYNDIHGNTAYHLLVEGTNYDNDFTKNYWGTAGNDCPDCIGFSGISCTADLEPTLNSTGDVTVCTSLCGNGVINPGEVCDGSNLNGQTCESLGMGFGGGTLACMPTCASFNTSGCTYPLCGDGIVQPGEQCEPIQGTCCNNLTCMLMIGAVCRASTGVCDPAETCIPNPVCPINVNYGDTDGDGRCNNTDNCVTVANPSQTDADPGCDIYIAPPVAQSFLGHPILTNSDCSITIGQNVWHYAAGICTLKVAGSNHCLCKDGTQVQCTSAIIPGDGAACGYGGGLITCTWNASVGDGIGDACDNCWGVSNPNQSDTDGSCSAYTKPYTFDPLCGDACQPAQVCGNSIVEGTEQCDGGACCNSNCTFKAIGVVCRASTGVCDPAETCNGTNSTCPSNVTLPDTDGDGACDISDNCQTTYNPDQLNTDNDNGGDVCDACPSCSGVGCCITSTSGTVGTSGGTITTPIAEISIPVGTFTADRSISATEITWGQSGYALTEGFWPGSNTVFLATSQPEPFDPPLNLTIHYLTCDQVADPGVDACVYDPAFFIVYFYNATTNSLQAIGGTVDYIAQTITVPVTHFSWYAILKRPLTTATSPASDISVVRSSSFDFTGTVTCSNVDCGNVMTVLEMSTGTILASAGGLALMFLIVTAFALFSLVSLKRSERKVRRTFVVILLLWIALISFSIFVGITGMVTVPTTSAQPFYTTSPNPQDCGPMNASNGTKTCTNVWTIFATGSIGTTATFNVAYSSSLLNSTTTNNIVVTISEQIFAGGCDIITRSCTEWSTCAPNGKQTRICTTFDTCTYTPKNRTETQNCTYTLVADCSDDIRNQDETDVDCGGTICASCANGKICSAGSDCVSEYCYNDVCHALPSCTDGIRNQDETGTDCGGEICESCPVEQPIPTPEIPMIPVVPLETFLAMMIAALAVVVVAAFQMSHNHHKHARHGKLHRRKR